MNSLELTQKEVGGLPAPTVPPISDALAVWGRIGLMSFGGPAGQIALMHRILVEERRWIGEQRFLHALNYCMLLPGPEAQQLATYIGWLLHRTWGGILAGVLFVLPGFFVILALSALYAGFQEQPLVAALFFGIKAAVLAVVIEALHRIAKRALKNGVLLAIAAAAFVAIFFFEVPFPLIVLAAGLIGFFGSRALPNFFLLRNANGQAGGDGEEGLVDRIIAAGGAAHTRAAPARAVRVAVTWSALWAAPVVLLLLLRGWEDVFTQLAIFFSQMAVVTFGGAYAVLAYVAQQAVESYGWLAPGEMLDGLGLAETTPGPLILVVEYVGFLAAFREATGLPSYLAGVLGATLVVWVTFVPCFLWIFLGAPFVETLRGKAGPSAALSAITAAVVGVILNLAIWFALHVLFAELEEISFGPLRLLLPELGSLDLAAAVLAGASFFALYRLKLGMIATLAIAATAGAGWTLLT